jgi:hypothetical protein
MILQHNIFMCCETFVINDAYPTPIFLRHYDSVVTPAVKNKQKGRASGGIVIMYDKLIFKDVQILDSSQWWLFLKLTVANTNLQIIVAMVYINQNSTDFSIFCDQLEITLNKISCTYNQFPIWLCGDFNSRIGDSVPCYDDGQSKSSPEPRSSLDPKVDSRGTTLLELVESCGLGVLNGTTWSDTPANYTFLGTQGNTVIDLCFMNLSAKQLTADSEVQTITGSDHLPYSVSTNIQVSLHCIETQEPTESEFKMVWDAEKRIDYKTAVSTLVSNRRITELESYVGGLKEAAGRLGMMKKPRQRSKVKEKPWFDKICRGLKRTTREALRVCKRRGFTSENMENYLSAKRQMKQHFKNMKHEYWGKKKDKLAEVNRAEFWKEVSLLKYHPQEPNPISKEAWHEFYLSILPERNNLEFTGQDARHPFLDRPISMIELRLAIKRLKSKKAPGPEGLTNEFIKALPEDALRNLLDILNIIFDIETLPLQWSEANITNLHKDGPVTIPANYRPVALLNNSLKLFTRMLLGRLEAWVESCSLLPESQAGFRKGRDCTEQIFNLQSVVNTKLMSGRKVYGVFVDFQRAFPSINHHKLFEKLNRLGVSTKFIRIIKAAYDNASMRIKTAFGLTDPIPVSEGVLQGEQLSPLLFNLFIADMEEFFLAKGCDGIKLSEKQRVMVLLYADDLLLVGDSPADLQKKLRVLSQYCAENSLKVNIKKTKVIVFTRGGRLQHNLKFFYDGEELQIVNSYIYLGVCVSSSGVFHRAAEQSCSKARQKAGVVRNLVTKGRPSSWSMVTKLFDACVLPTLLYAAPVWSLRYLDRLERVQTNFFKSTLYLPRNTPNYMVRYELGRTRITVEVFRRILKFWGKILRADSSRLLKKCYLALLDPQFSGPAHEKYNWTTQLKNMITSIGYSSVWESQSFDVLCENFGEMVEHLRSKFAAEDICSVQRSSYNDQYSRVKNYPEPAAYLALRAAIPKLRIIARFRLYSTTYSRFSVYTNQGQHILLSDPDDKCPVCNREESETPEHFLWRCPIYSVLRIKYLGNSAITPDPKSLSELNNIFYFVMSSLKLRAFVLNE